ncbi:pentapeptide repeat-containing protein [Methanocorpusculum parvum]|uniref:Pentapeptide repeat-containing protein n=1 Tax=Methanocorpusculum parvum TaxID=2193 RepID=A0AAX0Q7W3_9EURY|nr:pentapeptide repeat-containing protein [Methanocorpusculum parvum]PAV09305.1 hypothetical protein ASJ83_08195 [Methanocorpusculum parvum]
MVERPEGWNEDLYNKLSLEYLIECAKNEQFDEWNQAYEAYLKSEWKRLFPDEKYDLGNIGKLFYDGSEFVRPDFQEIDFTDAIKEQAYFIDAHLEDANIDRAHLEGANFNGAHLKGVNFNGAHLENASFGYANLENAYFKNAHLENADLHDVHLEGASFNGAHLEDARIEYAHLEGAQITLAVVNGDTLFFANTIDDKTDFTGTSLSSARILPELRTQLERNIRQIRWEKWYNDNKLLEIPARIFWKISDYGSSTRSILFTFLFSNFIFTMIYLALRDANLLHGTILSSGNDILLVFMQTTLVPFGILGIDLTTLSPIPITIIFIQVIFGYIILAALVTRMAIMFQNLSP